MTKEQYYTKYGITDSFIKADLEAVITTEIAKVQPEKQNTMVQEKQLKELFKYIEQKWDIAVEGRHKTDIKRIFGGVLCEDIMNDTLHEVKAEPTEQPSKPFDKERFERMFRAVIETHEATMNALKQLDAYYATKNN